MAQIIEKGSETHELHLKQVAAEKKEPSVKTDEKTVKLPERKN